MSPLVGHIFSLAQNLTYSRRESDNSDSEPLSEVDSGSDENEEFNLPLEEK